MTRTSRPHECRRPTFFARRYLTKPWTCRTCGQQWQARRDTDYWTDPTIVWDRVTPASTAGCHHQRTIDLMNQRAADQRTRAEAAQADLVDRLTTRYYALSALVEDDFAHNITAGRSDRIGQMTGLRDALAEVTGIDPIVVGFRLEHGIPVTENWVATNDGPDHAPDIRLLHDDVREPAVERLDRLRRDALKATGHPMYAVLYAPETIPG